MHHRLCPTTKRVYGIVYSQTQFCYGDPYSGSLFSIEGRGGGIGFYNDWEEEPNFNVSPLNQKEAIDMVFRSMHPSGNFGAAQSCVEVIPGSTP